MKRIIKATKLSRRSAYIVNSAIESSKDWEWWVNHGSKNLFKIDVDNLINHIINLEHKIKLLHSRNTYLHAELLREVNERIKLYKEISHLKD